MKRDGRRGKLEMAGLRRDRWVMRDDVGSCGEVRLPELVDMYNNDIYSRVYQVESMLKS